MRRSPFHKDGTRTLAYWVVRAVYLIARRLRGEHRHDFADRADLVDHIASRHGGFGMPEHFERLLEPLPVIELVLAHRDVHLAPPGRRLRMAIESDKTTPPRSPQQRPTVSLPIGPSVSATVDAKVERLH